MTLWNNAWALCSRCSLSGFAPRQCIFKHVYLILRSKNTCWQSLPPSANNAVLWVNSLPCCAVSLLLWPACMLQTEEGCRHSLLSSCGGFTTMGELSVASLFVVCHVILHDFGRGLAGQHSTFVLWVRGVYLNNIKRNVIIWMFLNVYCLLLNSSYWFCILTGKWAQKVESY